MSTLSIASRFDRARLAKYCRLPRHCRCGVAALVDLGDRHSARAALARAHPDARLGWPAPRAGYGGGRPAGAAGRARCARHGLGRRVMGSAMGRCRLILQAAGDPAAARAIPPLGARKLGARRLCRVLRRSAGALDLLPRPEQGRCRAGEERGDPERRVRHLYFRSVVSSRPIASSAGAGGGSPAWRLSCSACWPTYFT